MKIRAWRLDSNELLKTHRIYPTPQRVAVADVLFMKHQHLTADEVYDQVKRNANVSKATIYNTLSLFSRHGLVREIVADPSKIFYDSNNTPHHHFYNVDSGCLTDIENDNLSEPSLSSLPPNTVLDSMDVVVRVKDAS